MKTNLRISKVSIANQEVDVLHDQLGEIISGNKIWKLYHLTESIIEGHRKIKHVVTIGGAYSNSVLAIAAWGQQLGISTTAFIRGEELAKKELNPILNSAKNQYGMNIRFISREDYRDENRRSQILSETADSLDGQVIDEGVSCEEGFRGAELVFSQIDLSPYELVVLPVGYGTTLAGLLAATQSSKVKIFAFPALNNKSQVDEHLRKFLDDQYDECLQRLYWTEEFIFGGFAKSSDVLNNYVTKFTKHNLPVDWRYTGKMFYGLEQLLSGLSITSIKRFDEDETIEPRIFPVNSRKVLAVHTGGNLGMDDSL